MVTSATAVLPGDDVSSNALPKPSNTKKPLTLGPGLRHTPPDTITATIAGALVADPKKNATWVEYNSGRYLPATGDLVIATVSSSTAENFNCQITPHTPVTNLPHLAFEGATRKTRPQLTSNSIVYCRIASASRDTAPELTCVDPSTGKSEGLGPLKGGMLFKISLSMARRLLAGRKGRVSVLEHMSEKIGFEIAVGRNGILWVNGATVRQTLAVGRAIQEVDDSDLGEKAQKKVAEKFIKESV